MADGYTCLGEIDAGSSLASGELLFLASLFVELGGIVEFEANLSRTLGFSDVYRCPACRAENFIRVNKPSEGLLKSLGALRVRAYELLRMKLEEAGHRRGPPIDFANFDPVLWRENGWQERVAKMIDDARTTPPPPRPGP